MITFSELRDSVQKAFPLDKLAPDRDASWKLIAEMGWIMIDLPEDQGGLGLGGEAAATIHYELGAVLSTGPLIPAMLGLRAIAASALADRDNWIERICGGEYVPLHMLPSTLDGSNTLSGTISGVFEADMARHIIAGLPGRYLLIPLDAPGVRVIERPLWDETRRLFDVELDGYAPTLVLAQGDAAKSMHDILSPMAQLAVAADALGGAGAALAMTVDYLGLRKQFDRPLAMFQALKHRCADLKMQIVTAEALLWSLARREHASLAELGAMKAHATDVYRAVTEEMIQLHGGIGLTQEHPCHLFLKRAMLDLQLCGSLDHWQEARGRACLEQGE